MAVKISVLMSVYNQDNYVSKAVDSVLGQGFRDYEMIIVNDASTDRTREILHSYHDPRLRIVTLPVNFGKACCMNLALNLSSGEYLLEIDGDDWLEPFAMENLVTVMDDLPPEIAYVYGDRRIYRDNGQGLVLANISTGKPFFNRYDFVREKRVFGPRFLRAQAVRDIGGWPTDFPYGGRLYEDMALLFRLLDKYDFYYAPGFYYSIRKHNTNITNNRGKEWEEIVAFLTEQSFRRWGY